MAERVTIKRLQEYRDALEQFDGCYQVYLRAAVLSPASSPTTSTPV
jgi:hypothetical protein